MSEQSIQSAVQTLILAMDEFSSGDVTISDWSVLDLPVSQAPFAVIARTGIMEATPVFGGKYDATRRIKMTVYEPMGGSRKWDDLETALRNTVDAVELKLMENLSLGITPSSGNKTEIVSVSGAGQEFYYGQYVPPELMAEAVPEFVGQVLEIEVYEQVVLSAGEFA